MEKELREYQKKIISRVVSTNRDSVVCLPTGGGKTVITSGIMEEITKQAVSQTVLFVVPRLELIKQAAEEFGNVDIIWSDKTSLNGKKIIVASKDSLRTQYKKLPDNLKEAIRNGTVIFDECHVSLEQSYKLVQMMEPGRVLGLTATPERMDGQALLKGDDAIHKFGIFDDVIQEETVPSLIEKGYLSPLRYYAKPIEGISDIKPDNPTADELSGQQMMAIFDEHNIWGDLIRSYETYGRGRPALGFTTTVAMAELVVEIFQKAGYDFHVIHGGMGVKERSELIEKLRTHQIDGLVNAALLTYGFDCPPVSYAFNCRHIKSRPLWFQVVGRILRTCEGKNDAVFVDHADSISEFSEPDCSLPIMDETIQWRVNGESKEQKQRRKKAMKKVQDTMKLIQELDPLPAEMVEVTMENTWERLVRIIQRLRKENAQLLSVRDRLESKTENLERKVEQHQKEVEQLQAEKQQILKDAERHADPDQTFEYVRRRYIQYRRQVTEHNAGLDRDQAHLLVKRRFLEEEKTLPFLYDKLTFDKGMSYWYNHYESKISENAGTLPSKSNFVPRKANNNAASSLFDLD